MIYPELAHDSQIGRRHVQAVLGLNLLDVMTKRFPDRAAVEADRWQDALVTPYFDFSIAHALSWREYMKRYDARFEKWAPVGLAIGLLVQSSEHHAHEFQDGVTLTKAVSTAAARSGRNIADVMREWAQAKPVAHLLTSALSLVARRNWQGGWFPERQELPEFFTVARSIQRFLTNADHSRSVDKFRNASLPLPSQELWTIPDGGMPHLPLPEVPVVHPPLAPNVIDEMKKSRAQKAKDAKKESRRRRRSRDGSNSTGGD
jgi:hypothetical protein